LFDQQAKSKTKQAKGKNVNVVVVLSTAIATYRCVPMRLPLECVV
jgi:hypothetical protein